MIFPKFCSYCRCSTHGGTFQVRPDRMFPAGFPDSGRVSGEKISGIEAAISGHSGMVSQF